MKKFIDLNADTVNPEEGTPLRSDRGVFGNVRPEVFEDFCNIETRINTGEAVALFNLELQVNGEFIREVYARTTEIGFHENIALVILDALTLHQGGAIPLTDENIERLLNAYYETFGNGYFRLMEICNNPSLYNDDNQGARLTNAYKELLRRESSKDEHDFILDVPTGANNYVIDENNDPSGLFDTGVKLHTENEPLSVNNHEEVTEFKFGEKLTEEEKGVFFGNTFSEEPQFTGIKENIEIEDKLSPEEYSALLNPTEETSLTLEVEEKTSVLTLMQEPEESISLDEPEEGNISLDEPEEESIELDGDEPALEELQETYKGMIDPFGDSSLTEEPNSEEPLTEELPIGVPADEEFSLDDTPVQEQFDAIDESGAEEPMELLEEDETEIELEEDDSELELEEPEKLPTTNEPFGREIMQNNLGDITKIHKKTDIVTSFVETPEIEKGKEVDLSALFPEEEEELKFEEPVSLHQEAVEGVNEVEEPKETMTLTELEEETKIEEELSFSNEDVEIVQPIKEEQTAEVESFNPVEFSKEPPFESKPTMVNIQVKEDKPNSLETTIMDKVEKIMSGGNSSELVGEMLSEINNIMNEREKESNAKVHTLEKYIEDISSRLQSIENQHMDNPFKQGGDKQRNQSYQTVKEIHDDNIVVFDSKPQQELNQYYTKQQEVLSEDIGYIYIPVVNEESNYSNPPQEGFDKVEQERLKIAKQISESKGVIR